MMRKPSLMLFIIITSLSLLNFSCKKDKEVVFDIQLPPAPLESESETWAVINSAYLRLRDRPESEAKLVSTLWKGYVLRVESRSSEKQIVDGEENYWYRVTYDGLNGWVFGSYLEIFNSQEEAEIRSRAIKAD